MEAIAEINDLACKAIECGDYQIALDVLNSCLGCVKQLKKCRSPSMVKDRIADEGRKTTIETVVMLLKGTKRKLMNRSAAAATSAAFTTRNNNNKRKAPTDISITTAVIESSSRGRAVALPPTKRRRRTLDDNPEEVHLNPAPSSEEATTTVATNLDPVHNFPNQSRCCPNNPESEQRFFVYRKPLRLTKFQWSLIVEYQSSQINREQEHQSQSQIDREIELAVSSNLIFNIALTHHMISFPPVKLRGKGSGLQPGNNDDTDDDDDDIDDENGCGYDRCEESISETSGLNHVHRLKGALRLYELGFRVHTKRVAYIASHRARSPGASSPPTNLDSFASLSSPLTRPPPREARSISFSSGSEDTRRRDRDEELKSTTRFVLALLNNCCHIHQELGQTDKANVFQKRLLSFMLVIIDSGESIHDIIGDDPTLEGYLKNVFDGTVFNNDSVTAAMA